MDKIITIRNGWRAIEHKELQGSPFRNAQGDAANILRVGCAILEENNLEAEDKKFKDDFSKIIFKRYFRIRMMVKLLYKYFDVIEWPERD